MKKNLGIPALIVSAGLLFSPAPLAAAGVGTTGAQFLKVGVGARQLAMGSAAVALIDDANALNWNPGALGAVKRRNVTASYNSLFKDQNQGFLAYASPLPDDMGTWAAGFNYLTVSDIEKRTADTEDPESTFSNQNFALSASYGRPTPVSGLSIGGNLKYIREKLDTFSGNAVALDIGALYQTRIEHLSAGFMMQNLGSKIGPDPLPLTFKGGAAYKLCGEKLVLASDIDWLAIDQRVYWDIGSEFWANKNLAVRAGYQFGHAQDRLQSSLVGFAFGLGLRLEQLRVDYAFLPFGDLGDTHRITLGWNFR
ncbi:MAG: PorV/PorQ family protein [Elusimicrobia bacterium]|nr:PorV/PorQ family protein [Elusimicrobiota bacterium]